jgi:ABC-type Fe3+/spermidine/putrescine transport system ATPase subunit
LRIQTALGELAAIQEGQLEPGNRCVVCIRPENVALDGRADAGRNRLSGRIAFAHYLGNTLRYDVELAGGIVFKFDIGDPWHHERLPAGAPVELSCSSASTLAIPAG